VRRLDSLAFKTILPVAAMSVLFAGCSAGVSGISGLSGLGPGKLPYQASNAIMSAGYSEAALAPDHYRIEVMGYPTTSRERMEKIAATRAAEIGKDNRLGYFKINSVEQTTRCKKFTAGGQRGGVGSEERKLAFLVLTADVTYTKSPPDTTYVEAKTVFDQYRAELDADVTPPLPADSAGAICS
jgi:hypothetical protein